MSDERDERDERPDSPEEGEPHGVVETLREELHEVAEHVPKPVRWTVGKLVRISLLALLGLVVLLLVSTVAYFANRTELVAHELTIVLNHALAEQTDLVLEMRDIKGNPFTGFRVVAPRVRYRDGAGTVLEAGEMRVRYSLWGLVTGGPGPVDVLVEKPIVRLDLGPKKGWRVPEFRGRPSAKRSRPRVLAFSLELKNATLVAPKPLERFTGLDLAVRGSTGTVARVEVRRLRWREGPWHSRLEDLRASVELDRDSTRFALTRLRTGDLDLTATGGWANGGTERRVHADVARVRWSWLAEVFDNDSFDVPGEGAATVDASGDRRWAGTFRSKLTWDSLAVAGTGRFTWDGRQLAIDGLDGRSLAGDFRGRLRWSKLAWEVGGDARDADPAHWGALRLVGWPAGRLSGRFLYRVKTETKATTESRLTATLAPSEWAGWRVDSAVVRVDFPAAARDSFSVAGWRRGGSFTLRAGIDPDHWAGPWTITDLPLEEWPDGRATGLTGVLSSGRGRVENRGGDLFVSGDLEGRATTWSAAHFAHWELRHVDGRLLPTPDLTADAVARRGFFTGIRLDSVSAPLRLGDQRVDFASLRARAGDTLVTLAGGAAWDGDRWRLSAASARMTSDQFDWVAEPPLVLSGDRDGTVSEHVVAHDGDSQVEVRGRWASAEGAYDFAFDGKNLDLARLGMPAEWGMGGRADARLTVSGRPDDPKWAFEGRASHPAFGGHVADSLSLSLSGEPNALDVEDLLFALDGGTLRGDLSVEAAPAAWPDSLTGTAVLRWLQDAGRWSGRVQATRFPVDHLGAMFKPAAGWMGRVDGTLGVGGSPPAPELQLSASAADFGWRDYRAQRIEAGASYRDGTLDVPDLRITMLDVVSTVRGHMPLQIAIGHDPVLPDRPMSWRVQVPRGDLKLLPALVPLFQAAAGRFDLEATVAGTPEHPQVSGTGHVRDGIVRPAGREEILEGVHADLHFDESKLTLDTLYARQGRSGRVSASGTVQMNGFEVQRYLFGLTMRDFASQQQGLYAALFDGDFQVTDGPEVQGEKLPQVTGDVRLKRGVVEFDFANQSEVQARMATTEPLYWTYRIHLEAPSNLRWRPPDGDIEFDADLDLEQTPDSLLIYGEMHLIRGYYYFLSNRFSLTQADLTFDNQQGVDPQMTIVATTKLVPTQKGYAEKRQAETITAEISGRASQPVITLSGPEGWDQREILAELTYGRFTDPSGQFSADPLQNYVTRQLTNQLSQDLSKFFNNAISQWTVEREQGALFGAGGAGDVYVGFSGDVNDRTSFTYRQRVPGLDRGTAPVGTANLYERDVEVEYRINRFIYLTTELAQRRTSLAQSTAANGPTDFNVNLKARWEY